MSGSVDHRGHVIIQLMFLMPGMNYSQFKIGVRNSECFKFSNTS